MYIVLPLGRYLCLTFGCMHCSGQYSLTMSALIGEWRREDTKHHQYPNTLWLCQGLVFSVIHKYTMDLSAILYPICNNLGTLFNCTLTCALLRNMHTRYDNFPHLRSFRILDHRSANHYDYIHNVALYIYVRVSML